MKCFTFVLFLIPPFILSAQCKTGDVHIFNEEKLAAFIKEFKNCDTISGNLIIGPEVSGGQTRLVEIKGLEKIKVIKGNLEIRSNQWLEDIACLQNVELIEGDFIFKDNPKMKNAVTFKITKVLGKVEFFPSQFSNASVAFPFLTFIGKDLLFSYFQQRISAFPVLKTIGENLRYYSYAQYCEDLNQLQNVKSVTMGFRQSNVEIRMLQKLRKAESFSLEVESIRQITLSPAMKVDYLTLNSEFPYPLTTFSHNKKYKGLTVYNIQSTKHFKELFGHIDSVGYLLLESKTDPDTFLFHQIKYVEVAMLYGGAIKVLPQIKTIGKQLQIRGRILPGWIEKYVNRSDFIPEVTVNGLLSTQLNGKPRLFCDVFRIEHNSHLNDLKNFQFKDIRAGLIEIKDSKIDSINFDLTDIDLTKTQLAFVDNDQLSYCPADWACRLYKQHALFDKKIYDFIFSGNRSTCNDLYLKNECEK